MLNVKLTKIKNTEFRLKLDAWKNRELERKATKKRNFEHGKAIRETFERTIDNFNLDKDKITDCIIKYNEFVEDMNNTNRDSKIINNFLGNMPESTPYFSWTI